LYPRIRNLHVDCILMVAELAVMIGLVHRVARISDYFFFLISHLACLHDLLDRVAELMSAVCSSHLKYGVFAFEKRRTSTAVQPSMASHSCLHATTASLTEFGRRMLTTMTFSLWVNFPSSEFSRQQPDFAVHCASSISLAADGTAFLIIQKWFFLHALPARVAALIVPV